MRLMSVDMRFYPADLVSTYMNIRGKVQPGYTYVGDMLKDWGELSKLIHEYDISAVHYLRWIWKFYTRHKPVEIGIAHVSMVASPKSLKIYMDNASYTERDRELELRVKLDIQTDVIQTEITCGRTLRDILLDESLVVGVVVRYALAHSGGLKDLVMRFCREAEHEIVCEPLYVKLLSDKLPPGQRTRL